MTDSLYSTHSPVLKVDGTTEGSLARDLVSLEVCEATDGMKTCVVTLVAVGPRSGGVDEGQLYLDGRVVDFGKELEVSIGPRDDARVVFKGLISAIEGRFDLSSAPHVLVYAEDKLMKLRMTRRFKAYEEKSDADIARAIAREHGLDADVDAPGPTYDVVHQWNQSDLAFLRDRARLIQAELWLDGSSLCFKSRGARTGTSLTLCAGDELKSVRIRADLAHQRSKVKVSGYDAQERDKIAEEAGSDEVSSEAGDGRSGPDVLSRAFGDRVSYRVREAPLTSDEARAFAKGEMLRRARAFVQVDGVTTGTPDLQVGSRIELANVGGPFGGAGYYVTRVRHTFDLSRGHQTFFDAERASLRAQGEDS
jgi:phage protein D